MNPLTKAALRGTRQHLGGFSRNDRRRRQDHESPRAVLTALSARLSRELKAVTK